MIVPQDRGQDTRHSRPRPANTTTVKNAPPGLLKVRQCLKPTDTQTDEKNNVDENITTCFVDVVTLDKLLYM